MSKKSKKLSSKSKEKVPKKRQAHPNFLATAIKPGEVRNPAGRVKGSRNKFGEKFIQDFMADWEAHGTEVLRKTRAEDPATYLRVAASIVPKELNITTDTAAMDKLLKKMGDDELDKLINGLVALGAGRTGRDVHMGDAREATPEVGAKPDRVH